MKINILGETIDLTQVYKIGEIVTYPENAGFGFFMTFLNKTESVVRISTFSKLPWETPEEYDKAADGIFYEPNKSKRLALAKESLTNLRNQIVKVWMQNQSTLPSFEFEKPGEEGTNEQFEIKYYGPFSLEELRRNYKIEPSKFTIGVDCHDKNVSAYTLFKETGNHVEILLSKKRTASEEEFKQEVENLAKYFNADLRGDWIKKQQ